MSDYTLIQSGDADAAENVGALAGAPPTDCIVQGLALSNYDAGTPAIDVDGGKTAHLLDTATAEWTLDDGTQVSEQRDQVQVVCHLDARAGVALTDGDVNHLFVEPNWTSDDSPQLVVNTTGTPPSDDAVKAGEVDTANDTVSSQWNLVAPDGTLTYPDAAAASAAAASLQDGTVVYDRSGQSHSGVVAGSLKSLSPWTDDDGIYTLPSGASGVSVGTVSADDAIIGNRDVLNTFSSHETSFNDLFIQAARHDFELGLSQLAFRGGQYEIFANNDKITSSAGLSLNLGSPTNDNGYVALQSAKVGDISIEQNEFTGHSNYINSVYIDGSYGYSASFDETVKKWDVDTMTQQNEFTGHSHYINSVYIDGSYGYSASDDDTVKKWGEETQGETDGNVQHTYQDVGFVPKTAVISDDLRSLPTDTDVYYEIADDNGNSVTIQRSDIDGEVDVSSLTSSNVNTTAYLTRPDTDTASPELDAWALYLDG